MCPGWPRSEYENGPACYAGGAVLKQCLPDQTTGKEDRKVLPDLILYTSCILMSAEA